jgi:hypothetical protein
MPKDLYFWLAVIAAVLALGVLAIWRWQKNVSVAVGPVKISTSDRDALASTPDHVTVAKGADVQGHVGEVVGRTGATDAMPHGPTSVAEQMKVGKDGHVDRIVGVEVGKPK